MSQMPAAPGQQQQKSVWPKILLGCLAIVVLGVIGLVVLFNFGVGKFARAIEENAKNPAVRAENAKRMLGAAKLPDGYYPISGTLDIPLVTHVELSDRAPDKNGFVVGFDKRGFIYTQSIYTESTKKLESFFSGAPDAPQTVEDIGVRFRPKQELRSGSIAVGNETIRYRAAQGRVEQKEFEAEGPMVLMWIDCAGKKKERYAVWFGPDPAITEESSIRSFMGQFDLCRER